MISYVIQANYEGNGWDDSPYNCETLEAARNTVKFLSGAQKGFKYRIVKQTREVVK